MNPLDILLSWLAPILDPLKTFRSQTAELNAIHHTSVQTLENLVAALTTPGPDAFTGEAARVFSSATMEYMQTEKLLSGTGTNVGGANLAGPLLAAAVVCDQAEAEAVQAAEVAAVGVTDVEPLIEATAVIDATTAAQAGLDVPEDIVAAAATDVTLSVILQILADLALVIGGILWVWQSIMHAIGNQPLPKLPPTPTPQTIPFPANLTKQEQQLVNDIIANLTRQGKSYNQSEIESLVREGYTYDQIIAILEGAQRTPEGRPITKHAAYNSLDRHSMKATEVDYVMDNVSPTTQRDGAKVYLVKQEGRGIQWTIVIYGIQGVVTAMKNLDRKELKDLSKRYGFKLPFK